MYGGEKKVYTGFWWRNLMERDHVEDPGLNGRVLLRRVFKMWVVGVWTGLRRLRIGTGCGHF